MLPPAPGLFSMTKLTPQSAPSRSAHSRPMMSVAPAGGKGTTSFMVRLPGNPWARASDGAAMPAASPPTTARRVGVSVMILILRRAS